ncbi:MAG: Lipopolysaccharide core heptosyltransferase RfaQ [candidate division BRC1 bacterium ADurb.BinA364]|nr:MAG: Lipopolysaccharide core heptosyltransferase RfaQ [candidate division BRC1 bacterium ADurb.BinA364]
MQIDLAVASGAIADFYAPEPLFDRVHRIAVRRAEGARRLDALLREGGYDAVAASYFHPALYPKVGHLFPRGGPCVLSFAEDNGLLRESDRARPALRLRSSLQRNEAARLVDLLELAGPVAPLEPWAPRFDPSETHAARAAFERLNPAGRPLVALHPGAARAEKRWIWERWFELAQRLEERGIPCAFIDGGESIGEIRRGVEERNLAARAVEPLPLRALAGLLSHASAFVTTDSGPKHLAYLAGTPTVEIYGPTDERRWGALFEPDKHIAVRRCAWDLMPEERDGLAENHQCALVEIDDVWRALERFLPRQG